MKTTAVLVSLTIAFAAGVLLSHEGNSPIFARRSHRFIGLGDLPGGMAYSIAKRVSADGSIVVGSSHSASGMQAFRWTKASGMSALGMADASAASSDGQVIVGYRLVDSRTEPAMWTPHSGAQGLAAQVIVHNGAANGVSADGSMIVGVIAADGSTERERNTAFLWTRHHGLKHLEHPSAHRIWSEAHAVSADGDVVVGSRRHESGHNEAFRWTRESGPIGLGVLPGHSLSVACDVSADGCVVVGLCSDYLTTEAFRWTKQTGMVSLGTLRHGKHGSAACGVSADGSVIVGSSASENSTEAFVWDDVRGMQSIRRLLVGEFDLGEVMRGWQLRSATAVSADGAMVVGYGINPDGEREAWMARVTNERATTGPVPMVSGPLTANRRPPLSF